jgi:hypothetical protein
MQGLHTVALDVRNIKRAHRDALAGVGETVLQGVGARAGLSGLRRMSVCGVRWEVSRDVLSSRAGC